jgi:hypothetical protein
LVEDPWNARRVDAPRHASIMGQIALNSAAGMPGALFGEGGKAALDEERPGSRSRHQLKPV